MAMSADGTFTRRSLLALSGSAALLPRDARAAGSARKRIPVGIEMYSIKEEEKKDLLGTLRVVAEMGYEGVEFWAPYLEWTPAQLKDVRKQLDDLHLRCFSTHNRDTYFAPENFSKVMEYNQALGSRFVVMAHPGKVEGLDGWKKTAEVLTTAHARLKPLKIRGGYHNHGMEWKPTLESGKRPIDLLTASTPKDFAFQLDTATCLASGGDPVSFIKANRGRVKSYHLKDWSPEPDKGYKVLLGEGMGAWPEIVDTAESVGGVEYYLIEQEGSRFSPLETAKRCLDSFRKIRDART
jgi:sugar phosphate isomerase/epimerase